MHGEGADGLVVAMIFGNAERAKGPDSRAMVHEPTRPRGGASGPSNPLKASSGATVRAG